MRLEVPPGEKSQRLDVWLENRLGEFSRTRIQSLIKLGHISAPGRKITAHLKISPGMILDVHIPPAKSTETEGEDIPLSILHEDNDVVVVDKVAGMVVHPAAGHSSGTLVNALLHHCRGLACIGGETRPGIVHRLDKDTSGVMVAAKNDRAMQSLVDQFKSGNVRKEYIALVHGRISPPSGKIETMIGRSEHDRKKMSASPKRGRRAVTFYETAEVLEKISILKVRIETGRTHQIRVHMASKGHPVAGDAVYGLKRLDHALPLVPSRQMLHAERLSFLSPATGQRLEFTAPLPQDIKDLMRFCRNAPKSNPKS